MLLSLLALGALAADGPVAAPTEPVFPEIGSTTEPMGPAPSQIVPVPKGLERGDVSTVPGPPEPCVSKVQVYVPWSVCKPWSGGFEAELPATRFNGTVRATPILQSVQCALVCLPDAKMANWSFVVPTPRYRGTMTCQVGRAAHTLEVGDVSTALSRGVTTQWQLDLRSTEYIVSDAEAIDGTPEAMHKLVFEATREIGGDNACPAGQPGG